MFRLTLKLTIVVMVVAQTVVPPAFCRQLARAVTVSSTRSCCHSSSDRPREVPSPAPCQCCNLKFEGPLAEDGIRIAPFVSFVTNVADGGDELSRVVAILETPPKSAARSFQTLLCRWRC